MSQQTTPPAPPAAWRDEAARLIAKVEAYLEGVTKGPWKRGRATDNFHAVAGGAITLRHSLKPQCYGEECWNVYTPEGGDVTAPCAGLSKADAEFIGRSVARGTGDLRCVGHLVVDRGNDHCNHHAWPVDCQLRRGEDRMTTPTPQPSRGGGEAATWQHAIIPSPTAEDALWDLEYLIWLYEAADKSRRNEKTEPEPSKTGAPGRLPWYHRDSFHRDAEGTVQRLIRLLVKERQDALDAREAAQKLQAFKDWVHKYLDDHGVPHHPPGTHGAEGCRIGDRMDWLMERMPSAPRGDGDAARELVEIVGPDGKVHYRRPLGHADVLEALRMPGYSVRGYRTIPDCMRLIDGKLEMANNSEGI